tara:strand:+ start:455 stop:859 length:405 start_codon:yes stop_codon:yes gene_type:complete
MKRSISLFLIIFLSPLFPKTARAAELLMVEQQGCYYCLEWKDEIGPIYPKTQEGKFAPIKFIDITEVDEIAGLQRDVVFTPTFILFKKRMNLLDWKGIQERIFSGLCWKLCWNRRQILKQRQTLNEQNIEKIII